MSPTAGHEKIGAVQGEAERWSAEEVLRWGLAEFHPHAAIASSFGAEDVALIDIAARVRPDIRVFTLDTDFLFAETYELIDQIEQKYGIRVERVKSLLTPEKQAELHGPKLWTIDPNKCCELRKVEPLKAKLGELTAWATGIRRDQAPTRANAKKIEWDEKFGLVKMNPLADWTWENVWEYVRAHNVPYNPLHEQNYPSIGCTYCTRQVQPGEDPRAGRWSGFAKNECGLHAPKQIRRLEARGSGLELESEAGAGTTMSLFPMFVKLDGRRCLVVGAGSVAEAKIESLLATAAAVHVVAPKATPKVREWAREGRIEWEAREYGMGDLLGVFLVIAATGSPALHDEIYAEARRRGVLCNAVDEPERCDFYFPAVVRRGELQIAISTGGLSPALAQRLRKELEQQFGPEWEQWVAMLGQTREELLSIPMPPEQRKRLLHQYASLDPETR